jgi:general L-amino acid transport system permease protein
MSAIVNTPNTPIATAARTPPSSAIGPVAWLKENLFRGWVSTAITLALGYVIIRAGIAFADWGLINAVWSVPYDAATGPVTESCISAIGHGACWAVIPDKWQPIIFGSNYPAADRWRPAICILLFIGLYITSANKKMWRVELIYVWIAVLAVIGFLMWGGLGLEFVPTDKWGGLPITMMLATFGLALAFPLAVVVALGRRSTKLPIVKLLCVIYVELIRGVPLISLLFMAQVMFPLFLPQGFDINELLRAQGAITLFAGAYLAEVIRGGLQALPKGQYEAADALGLSYWKKTGLIVLPQALRLVIPPMVNTFIGFFKDTSLVQIIGIFDLMLSAKNALQDAHWQPFTTEIYIFIGMIYFCFCYAMSRYSRGLEAEFNKAKRR